MAYIYFLIGTGIVALMIAAIAGVYEHRRSQRLDPDQTL